MTALRRALAVREARHHTDAGADIGVAQRVGRAGGAGDIITVALPVIADRAQPVGIRQGVRRRQRLIFRRRPVIVTTPVGASLTLPTLAVGALATALRRAPAVREASPQH